MSMLNPKKHPLEIFRARGRHGPLVPPSGASSSSPPSSPVSPASGESAEMIPNAPQAHARWEPAPFELRLSLFGTLMLAMLWIVLLAGAYTFGVKRGGDSSRGQNDANAKELGKRIENGAGTGERSDPGAGAANKSATPVNYGVLIATYSKSMSNEDALGKLRELRGIFEKSYQIPKDQVLCKRLVGTGEVEYYVGKFESKDDPELKALLGKLHMIADWPSGKKSPFESAIIKTIPAKTEGDAGENSPPNDK